MHLFGNAETEPRQTLFTVMKVQEKMRAAQGVPRQGRVMADAGL